MFNVFPLGLPEARLVSRLGGAKGITIGCVRTLLMSSLLAEGRATRQWLWGRLISPTMWRSQDMSLSWMSWRVPSSEFWMGRMAKSERHCMTESVTRSRLSQATGSHPGSSSDAASELKAPGTPWKLTRGTVSQRDCARA